MYAWASLVVSFPQVSPSEGKRPLGRPRRRWEDNIILILHTETALLSDLPSLHTHTHVVRNSKTYFRAVTALWSQHFPTSLSKYLATAGSFSSTRLFASTSTVRRIDSIGSLVRENCSTFFSLTSHSSISCSASCMQCCSLLTPFNIACTVSSALSTSFSICNL